MKRTYFIPSLPLLTAICMLLAVLVKVAYAQTTGGEIGAGDIVDVLTLPLTLLVGWLLRTFAFPALNGLAFLAMLLIIITPILAWLVGLTANLYHAPGHSYLQSVLYGALAVVVHQIKVQWDNWQNNAKEGIRRAMNQARLAA